MHITILALGSRGDIQPFIPLGQALLNRGHRVRVATFELFKSLVENAGLDYYRLGGDAQALLATAMQQGMQGQGFNLLSGFRTLRRTYGTLAEQLPEDLTGLRDTDLLLNQLPSHLFGMELAEWLDIPWAIASVIPLTRTRTRPVIGFPTGLSFISAYNLFSYRLAEQIGWQMFRGATNRLRQKHLGLPAAPFWGPYEQIYRQHLPVVCGFSERVVPRAADWGSHVHLTGWWVPQEPAWQAPDSLQRFLDTGPAPVFVGFGSMYTANPERTTAMIVAAAQQSGLRLILHSGWAGLGGDLPETVYRLDYAPYGWLFPRMAAVVHHGGSGTTGFALRSGVPSLVVPFIFDQFYWGERSAALGVGPAPLPFQRLSAERLAQRIRLATSDAEMQRKASVLGQALQAEDGVHRAVGVIENLHLAVK